MHFVDRTFALESDFTFYIFERVPFHNVGIGSTNALSLIRLQAIAWTNDDIFYCRIYRHKALASSHNNFCVMEKKIYDVIKLNWFQGFEMAFLAKPVAIRLASVSGCFLLYFYIAKKHPF